MRLVVLLVIAVNIVALQALTAKTNQQQALFDQSLVTKLKSTHIGRAIFLLAQVGEKSDYDTLFQALDNLGDSYMARMSSENLSFADDVSSTESDRQFYQLAVDQYTTEVAQHSIDIRALTQERQFYEATLQNKRNEIAEAKRQHQLLSNTLVLEEFKYRKQNDAFNSAITVLDKCITLLEKTRDQAEAFIEENHQEYQNTVDEMHKSFAELEGHHIMYQPIATFLVQVGTSGFADQQKLTKALKLLQGFRDSVNNSRLSLTNQYESNKKQNEDLLEGYNAKLTQLVDVVFEGLQEDIETKQGEIVTKQALLKDAQANLDNAQENLDGINGAWDKRTDTHKILIQEYNHELSVLQECVLALNAAGIRRSI